MNKRVCSYFLVLLLILGVACGSENEGGTGVSNPPNVSMLSGSQMASAAIGATFSETSTASLKKNLLDFFIRSAFAQSCVNDPGCVCENALAGRTDSFGVQTSASKSVGTYGSINTPITLGEEDFCALPNGTENLTSGSDGKGRFAGFTFTRDVRGSCSSGDLESEITIRGGSEGVYRFTLASEKDPEHRPEIYGNFAFAFGQTESSIHCTIYIGSANGILLADCDNQGILLDQNLNATCQF